LTDCERRLKPAQPNVLAEQAHGTPLHYRQDIDGLRALAVLPVLLYHAFPTAVPGGFIGVDIFFVISGYLITGIIHKQMLSKTFSIADFYARRIRRIFPALIVVVLATLLIGCYGLAPREMKSLGSNIAGSAIFIQNFVLLGQVGYFDLAAEKKPLLHLWSLGIEEQYYILWPLLLSLIGAWRIRSLMITIALAVASFIACVIVRRYAPDYAFYLPVTRAWELLVGSGLALWINGRTLGLQRHVAPLQDYRQVISIGALLVIVVAFLRYNPRIPHPGFFTLAPVLAAATLIAMQGTYVHRYVLSARPAVFIGLISYPLYLWHYPLMAYARIHFVDGVAPSTMWIIMVASVILAWMTYQLIERPIRFGQRRVPVKLAALAGGMAVLGVIGLGAVLTNGFPIRIPTDIRVFMLDGSETGPRWRSGKCLMNPEQSAAEFAPECAGGGRHPLIAVWGDSYAASLYPGLKYFGDQRGFDVAEFTASSCPPLVGFVMEQRRFCKGANDYTVQRLAELKPEAVIFYTTWRYNDDDVRAGFDRTIPMLRAAGINKIIVLGPPATWLGDGLPANLLDYYFQTHSLLPQRTWFRSNDAWTRPFDDFLEAQAKRVGIDFVSARRLMCNDDGCLTRLGADGPSMISFDTGHLTYPASIMVAEQVLKTIPGFDR
jgi:peptidoglycan/LPS O-acetylase OafA/YrhL